MFASLQLPPPDLDPQRSSGQTYRSVSAVNDEANKAEQILSETKVEDLSSKELKDLGLTFNEKSDYKKAQKFLYLALAKADEEKVSENEKSLLVAECYYALANCDREQGAPQEAIALFTKAKLRAEKITRDLKGLNDLKYVIARNIGIAYLIVEDYEKAVSSFADAVLIAKTTHQLPRLPAVLSYLGLSRVLIGKESEKGFYELHEARKLYPEEGREKSMDWAAHCYHMGRAYEKVTNLEKAKIEYAESRRLRMLMIDPSKIGSVYYHSRVGDSNAGLGRVFIGLGQTTKAEMYLKEAIENYEALGAEKKKAEMIAYLHPNTTSAQVESTSAATPSPSSAPQSSPSSPVLGSRSPILRGSLSTQTSSNMFQISPRSGTLPPVQGLVASTSGAPSLRKKSGEQGENNQI